MFYENYLGKTDATFTLNFSTGSAMVLAQYYTLIRFGHAGLHRASCRSCRRTPSFLAKRIAEIGPFQVIGADEEQLPLVAFRLAGEHRLRRVRHRLAGRGRARLDASRLHDAAEADHVNMLRALVKLNLSHALVNTLADDIAAACETLEKKGGASATERAKVKTGVGY